MRIKFAVPLFLVAFLLLAGGTSYLSQPELEWVVTRGGPQDDHGCAVVVSDGVVVTGSEGHYTAFLCKYSPEQTLLWEFYWEAPDYSPKAIDADTEGNIYITGECSARTDFDPGPATVEPVSRHANIFLCKFNPDGEFQWAHSWLGFRWNNFIVEHRPDWWGYDVSVDSSGYIYVTGRSVNQTLAIDSLPPADGNTQFFPDLDGYLCRFDKNGTLQWQETWHGVCDSVCVDEYDDVYVAGKYWPDPVSSELEYVPSVSIARLDSTGTMIWSRTLESSEEIRATSVCSDGNGHVYIAGYFFRTFRFDEQDQEPVELTSNRGTDVFLCRFDSSGKLQWARSIGDDYGDESRSVVADDVGNIYLAGGSLDKCLRSDPETGTIYSTYCIENVVTKLSSEGEVIWAVSYPGNRCFRYFEIYLDLDANGNLYVTGSFTGTADFDPSLELFEASSTGGSDIFFIKLIP